MSFDQAQRKHQRNKKNKNKNKKRSRNLRRNSFAKARQQAARDERKEEKRQAILKAKDDESKLQSELGKATTSRSARMLLQAKLREAIQRRQELEQVHYVIYDIVSRLVVLLLLAVLCCVCCCCVGCRPPFLFLLDWFLKFDWGILLAWEGLRCSQRRCLYLQCCFGLCKGRTAVCAEFSLWGDAVCCMWYDVVVCCCTLVW